MECINNDVNAEKWDEAGREINNLVMAGPLTLEDRRMVLVLVLIPRHHSGQKCMPQAKL